MSEQKGYHPRFTGIPTLMRFPWAESFDGLDVALVGVPFDLGVTHRAGARHGPRQVRDFSSMVRKTNHVTMVSPRELCTIADVGDVPVDIFSIEKSLAIIEGFYGELHRAGALPLSVGGDHLITLPILRGITRQRSVGLVHFDAHCDTEGAYMGNPYHHGTPFWHATLEGLIDPKRTVQIGIRGSLSDPDQWAFSQEAGMRVIGIEEYFDLGYRGVIAEIRRVVGDGPVYVSFDVDGLDPIYAPGTGTPEAGGFNMFEALSMVRALRGLEVIGADVVEVSPPFDPTGLTAMHAATILFELLCIMVEPWARKSR
jgi:guanidinopropionase